MYFTWNQLPKNLRNSTCNILSVQIENSISRLIFNEFQTILVSESKLECVSFKIKKIENQKKSFCRTFFGTPGRW